MNGRAMRWARAALIALGVGLAVFGSVRLAMTVPFAKLIWLPVWLAAVVIVHDGVLVPILSVGRSRLRRAGRTWPPGITAMIETAVMVFGTLALYVGAEVWAQQRGNSNPTVLQGDYAERLLVVAAVIAAIVLVVSRVLVARARRNLRNRS